MKKQVKAAMGQLALFRFRSEIVNVNKLIISKAKSKFPVFSYQTIIKLL